MKKTTLTLLMGLSLFGTQLIAAELAEPTAALEGQTLTQVNALTDEQLDAQKAQRDAEAEAERVAIERADKAAAIFANIDDAIITSDFKEAVEASIAKISNNSISVKEYFGGPEGFVGLLLEFNDGMMHRETITFVTQSGDLFVSGRLLNTELDYSTQAEKQFVRTPTMTPVDAPESMPAMPPHMEASPAELPVAEF